MNLAARLAVLCGSALLTIIVAAGLFTWQTAHISGLYNDRYLASSAEKAALGVDRDLHSLLATFNRLLFVRDPARRADLTADLNELDKTIDTELNDAVREDRNSRNRALYQPILTSWSKFQTSYKAELARFRDTGDAVTVEVDLDDQVTTLENQIRQIVA
jgi:hypothetical protein